MGKWNADVNKTSKGRCKGEGRRVRMRVVVLRVRVVVLRVRVVVCNVKNSILRVVGRCERFRERRQKA